MGIFFERVCLDRAERVLFGKESGYCYNIVLLKHSFLPSQRFGMEYFLKWNRYESGC